MTIQGSTPGTDLDIHAPHYVDWGSIIAGTVIASAVSVALFTFGAAIGLSMISPYEGEGVSRAFYFAALGLWTVWVIVSSCMAGGYIAGRMRRRIGDATEHEVDVRDGIHGLVVWGLSVLVASILLTLGVTGLVGTAAKTSGSAGIAAHDESTLYTIDRLFRAPPAKAEGVSADDRREIQRLFAFGMTKGELARENRNYLASMVANRTGLTQAEAERRVDESLAEAKSRADVARKTGILLGFLTAAALAVGGAAAAWSATIGGRHRDRGTDHRSFWRWA